MRYAIIGDIHSNLTALECVLADIEEQNVDSILCVGDIVGYAADPNECVEIVREKADCVVCGNHDYGLTGQMTLDYFNADARDALLWTEEQLYDDNREWLKSLPLVARHNGMLLTHSTPCHPEDFDYIQTIYDARLAFEHLDCQIGFIGHSHIPVIFTEDEYVDYYLVEEFDVSYNQRLIINVGSVGQPRDLDPRACYAVLDDAEGKLFIRRKEYDVEAAASRILEAGLPEVNANRLFLGR